MRIDVKFEKIFSHELVYADFVALDLVLDPDDFWISVPIQSSPKFLNLFNPDCMGFMR
jgi:hypothetical protein